MKLFIICQFFAGKNLIMNHHEASWNCGGHHDLDKVEHRCPSSKGACIVETRIKITLILTRIKLRVRLNLSNAYYTAKNGA
jgi:hypothetical protein